MRTADHALMLSLSQCANPPYTAGHAKLRPDTCADAAGIARRRGQAAQGLTRVDLLKVDVERAELDVLTGVAAADWFARPPPRACHLAACSLVSSFSRPELHRPTQTMFRC